MCGITGFIDYRPRPWSQADAVLADMTAALRHRGPDAQGQWIDPECRVGLGHTRLAIIDITAAGAQPMHSASGRYTITFNGEIYGFGALRDDLVARGVSFRGGSDTEVLLAAVEMFGIDEALARCNGMFAFAILDRHRRTIVFARDRIGKKPLYLGLSEGSIAFASELKSIRRHPAFAAPSVDTQAVALYVRHKYVPTPRTIYREVMKLPAGAYLSVSIDERPGSLAALQAGIVRYWDFGEAALRASRERRRDEDAALAALEASLRTAVGERMVSDVRLGAFLSGGVDSSLVVSVMQELSATPVRTFTVRFAEASVNEADIAAGIARHLKTDHTEITASAEASLDLVRELPEIYDEPFADPSQIPTLMVSRLAREHVTVALSGDGGDESFGGYARYGQMMRIEALAGRLPAAAFRAVAGAPSGLVHQAFRVGRHLLPDRLAAELSADRMQKLAELAAIGDFDRRYESFLTEWREPGLLVIGAREEDEGETLRLAGASPAERMMFADTITYLPDDILVKADRASMAAGLELRSPLLDHRLIEEAWRAPRELCLSNGQGKVALKRLLARRLPPALTDHPKRGFGVPMNEWLRGPLRDWAEGHLGLASLEREGVFHPAPVRRRWEEHLSGRRNWGSQLWTILMFNEWKTRWA